MAEQGLWTVCDLEPARLRQLPGASDAHVLLMDSIWLTPEHAAPFLELAARGRRVALLLHSFPSLIRAAEAGAPAPSAPSGFELEAMAKLGVVVAPGTHYAHWVQRSGARLVIAEPGLDAGWRAPPRPRWGPCRLVSVGAVTPRKGFLDVAELLQRRGRAGDYLWRVLGSLDVDREYAGRLRERIAGLPGVELLGQLEPSEVQQQVRAADVLLMPSYDENQPLVLLEAMAASVPSIAYAAGAARQMLEHDQQGFIAPIGDRRRFAEYLERVLSDEPRRRQLAEACWQRQQQLPSWSESAARARTLLEGAWRS